MFSSGIVFSAGNICFHTSAFCQRSHQGRSADLHILVVSLYYFVSLWFVSEKLVVVVLYLLQTPVVSPSCNSVLTILYIAVPYSSEHQKKRQLGFLWVVLEQVANEELLLVEHPSSRTPSGYNRGSIWSTGIFISLYSSINY